MKKEKKIFSFILGVLFGGAIFTLIGYQGNNLENVGYTNGNTLKTINNNVSEDQLKNIIKEQEKAINVNKPNKEVGVIKEINEIMELLNSKYLYEDKIDKEKMTQKAIQGFVDGLDDPYTSYLPPKEQKDFMDSLSGEDDFEGIGAVVQKHTDGIKIERPLEGQPAQKAGIKPLDIVISINGEETKNMTLSDAINKMRGKKGTKVDLRVLRPKNNNIFDVTLKRDTIELPSVKSEIIQDNIAYFNIGVIGKKTEEIFEKEYQEINNDKIKGVILDLRGNTGGYLNVSSDLASYFIPKGKSIVKTEYSNGLKQDIKSDKNKSYSKKPVLVLVDGYSASGAEIIAGALQEQRDAKLIGTKTFGKGSIQTIVNFENGAGLKYTQGEWFTPNDVNIGGKGLSPDIEIEFDQDLYENKQIDNQKQKAIEVLKEIIKS